MDEKEKFLEQLKMANEKINRCLSSHPELDKADLFRIALNSLKTALALKKAN